MIKNPDRLKLTMQLEDKIKEMGGRVTSSNSYLDGYGSVISFTFNGKDFNIDLLDETILEKNIY